MTLPCKTIRCYAPRVEGSEYCDVHKDKPHTLPELGLSTDKVQCLFCKDFYDNIWEHYYNSTYSAPYCGQKYMDSM